MCMAGVGGEEKLGSIHYLWLGGGGLARIRDHHIFQQWDGGSSKIIVEVKGVSLFFVQKAM